VTKTVGVIVATYCPSTVHVYEFDTLRLLASLNHQGLNSQNNSNGTGEFQSGALLVPGLPYVPRATGTVAGAGFGGAPALGYLPAPTGTAATSRRSSSASAGTARADEATAVSASGDATADFVEQGGSLQDTPPDAPLSAVPAAFERAFILSPEQQRLGGSRARASRVQGGISDGAAGSGPSRNGTANREATSLTGLTLADANALLELSLTLSAEIPVGPSVPCGSARWHRRLSLLSALSRIRAAARLSGLPDASLPGLVDQSLATATRVFDVLDVPLPNLGAFILDCGRGSLSSDEAPSGRAAQLLRTAITNHTDLARHAVADSAPAAPAFGFVMTRRFNGTISYWALSGGCGQLLAPDVHPLLDVEYDASAFGFEPAPERVPSDSDAVLPPQRRVPGIRQFTLHESDLGAGVSFPAATIARFSVCGTYVATGHAGALPRLVGACEASVPPLSALGFGDVFAQDAADASGSPTSRAVDESFFEIDDETGELTDVQVTKITARRGQGVYLWHAPTARLIASLILPEYIDAAAHVERLLAIPRAAGGSGNPWLSQANRMGAIAESKRSRTNRVIAFAFFSPPGLGTAAANGNGSGSSRIRGDGDGGGNATSAAAPFRPTLLAVIATRDAPSAAEPAAHPPRLALSCFVYYVDAGRLILARAAPAAALRDAVVAPHAPACFRVTPKGTSAQLGGRRIWPLTPMPVVHNAVGFVGPQAATLQVGDVLLPLRWTPQELRLVAPFA
jgi:hypothetical protein